MEEVDGGEERWGLGDVLSRLRTPLDLARLLRADVLLELAATEGPSLQVGRRQVLARYLPPAGWAAQVSYVHVQHLVHDVYLVGVTVLCGVATTRKHRVDITARVAFRGGRVTVICDYAQPPLPLPLTAACGPSASAP